MRILVLSWGGRRRKINFIKAAKQRKEDELQSMFEVASGMSVSNLTEQTSVQTETFGRAPIKGNLKRNLEPFHYERILERFEKLSVAFSFLSQMAMKVEKKSFLGRGWSLGLMDDNNQCGWLNEVQ